MNKFIKSIALSLAAASIFALSSCGKVTFEYTDGKLVNKSSKEAYTAAPVGYEPCGVGEEYGVFGEFTLYSVAGLDGEEFSTADWITEEYSGSATTFFYGENADFAPFEEMEPDLFYICEEDVSVFSLATVDDSAMVDTVCQLLEAEGDTLLPLTDINTTYTLKFYSEDHPQYFYSVMYCECAGGNYIYKTGSKFAKEIGGLLSGYLGATE